MPAHLALNDVARARYQSGHLRHFGRRLTIRQGPCAFSSSKATMAHGTHGMKPASDTRSGFCPDRGDHRAGGGAEIDGRFLCFGAKRHFTISVSRGSIGIVPIASTSGT
jgi:hypothetical protein